MPTPEQDAAARIAAAQAAGQAANVPSRVKDPAGLIVPAHGPWYNTVSALTASRGYVMRFVAPHSFRAVGVKFCLTTAAGANDACDAGIYDGALQLLASAGATTGKLNASPNTVQTLTFTTPVDLVEGKVYYVAFSSGTQGGTAAQLLMTTTSNATGYVFWGSSAPGIIQSFAASHHPLPASFTAGGSITSCPVMALVPASA